MYQRVQRVCLREVENNKKQMTVQMNGYRPGSNLYAILEHRMESLNEVQRLLLLCGTATLAFNSIAAMSCVQTDTSRRIKHYLQLCIELDKQLVEELNDDEVIV